LIEAQYNLRVTGINQNALKHPLASACWLAIPVTAFVAYEYPDAWFRIFRILVTASSAIAIVFGLVENKGRRARTFIIALGIATAIAMLLSSFVVVFSKIMTSS